MATYYFWKKWKKKTFIEKKAIASVMKAINLIVNAIPKNKLAAIYIKGSFVRREMNKKSDVDIVPIVTENKYEGPIFDTNSPEIAPCIIVPLSLWELRNNKLFTKNNLPRAKPDRFVKKLPHYKLIYGKPLDITHFKVRDDEKALKNNIIGFQNSILPLYKKGKLGFSTLIKTVFWLTELEQEVKGKKIKHSFKDIASSIKDKEHIIHDAYRFRLHPTKDKKERARFVEKLKKHLAQFERAR